MIRDLLEVCDLSEKQGVLGIVGVSEVRKLAEAFRSASVVDIGKQVGAIINSEDFGIRMSAIASLDIKTHAFLVEFTDKCAKFLKERLGKAAGQIINWGDDVVESAKQSVDEIFVQLEVATRPYSESDP